MTSKTTQNEVPSDLEIVKTTNRSWTTYTIKQNGKRLGKVETTTVSTDRQYNKVRLPGKGRREFRAFSARGKQLSYRSERTLSWAIRMVYLHSQGLGY
jgi:hypothetical protein